MTRSCVVVLGMHRSGTSMAAGILSKIGCDPAVNLMPANFANEKGYFESHPIAAFNDRLLISAASDWRDFQKIARGWFTSPHAVSAQLRASELVDQEYGTSALFLLKDPRMCRLMPFWRDIFEAEGISPWILHVHRSPLAVAASLAKRDGLSWDYSLLMWLRNCLEAENDTRGLTRHFVSYESFLGNWGFEIERMAKAFGLEWPRLTSSVAAEIRGFVTRDLRHHDHRPESVTGDPGLSEWIRDTFAIFERWAEEGESLADRERLDVIRDAFDRSVPAFAGLVKTSLACSIETKRLQSALVQQRGEADSALAQKAAAEKDAIFWRETSDNLQRQLEATAEEADERDRERRSELAELRHALSEQMAAQSAAVSDCEAERDKLALAFRKETDTMAASHREQIAAIAAQNKDQYTATALKHQKRMSHLEEELHRAQSHRDSLLASTSWRITAPLRRLSLLVRPR